jgi:hypothetical protein
MLVDASRRGVEFYWFWIVLIFQPFGAWAYFCIYKLKDFQGGHISLAGLLQRRPSLNELRHRSERLPTLANRLELAERLVEGGQYAEAIPHLQALLEHEPTHCQALFTMAECHRGLHHPEEAVPFLQKVIARHSAWGDYKAWRSLVEARRAMGDQAGALASCQELARVAPSLEHRCLLAEQLLQSGEQAKAGEVVRQGLDDYHYLTGLSRRHARRWVGKAKQILKQIG